MKNHEVNRIIGAHERTANECVEQEGYPLRLAVGIIVKRFRERLHMTQVSLAETAGVSQTWVSLIENTERTGRLKHPDPDDLDRVAIALKMDGIAELYSYAQELRDNAESRLKASGIL